MKSLFIVLEGIDGSGTSTQSSLLQSYFLAHQQKAVLSPEPSSGPIGNLIRQMLKQRVVMTQDRQKFDEQMAYLFAADRHDHLYNDIDGVFQLLQENITVITTRYYFSSLVYNSEDTETYRFVKQLNQKFPPPDLVIYLDIPVEVSLQRIGDRPFQDIYENQEKLKQVRQSYHHIFADYSEPLLMLNGLEEKKRIHQKIIDFIQELFSNAA